MSLFLDTAGLSDLALANLFTISGEDGGLGTTSVADPGVVQVTYTLTPGQPATATRLNTLVNTEFAAPIVITALNGGNDPYSNVDMTGNAAAYSDRSSGSLIIRVVYDASQCCGAGIASFDTGGNRITVPNPVILYHEMSHALRGVTNTREPDDEIPATADENVLRGQLGLCLRDVNNHDGDCAGGNNCGGSDGGMGGPPSAGCGTNDDDGCFIVTAATGSSQSAEIARLRSLRDRVAAASGLAAQLIKAIYVEYREFSPALASEIGQDAMARAAVLMIAVRPLLAWYTLAATLALEPDDRRAAAGAETNLRKSCQPFFGAARVIALLEAIRDGSAFPAGAPRMLRDLEPRIRKATELHLASWAILDPLMRAWTSARRNLNAREQVAEWLGTAPLAPLTPPCHTGRLDREIEALSAFCSFSAAARAQLGSRLRAEWPCAAAALSRHGFIEDGVR